MTSQEFSQLTFRLLDIDHIIKPFDSGDNDTRKMFFNLSTFESKQL